MTNATSYYVLNGHTLGYIQADHPTLFGVLAGSVVRGGHDWNNGPTIVSPSDVLVQATHADFEAYRVCYCGHLPPLKEA